MSTNVDYTFCTSGGRPLFSVEFDGLGGGFSRVGVYIPHRPTHDGTRKWKLDTKLRFAAAVRYPLMVISFEEVESFDDESITILDGIIGQFLAKQKLNDYIEIDSEVWAEYEGLGEYGEWARNELIQDAVTDAEVQSKLENDPLARRAAHEAHELFGDGAATARGGCMILRCRTQFHCLLCLGLPTLGIWITSGIVLPAGNKQYV